MKTINLVLLSRHPSLPPWLLGQVYNSMPSAAAINSVLSENLHTNSADAWLFWDPALGEPDQGLLQGLLETGDDCWHAGLALGLGGQPGLIDFVSPTWMLNRDPDETNEATSWRLSLRACLVRSDVLRQLGGPRAEFASLEASGLELGLRYIRRGAFVRHVPGMVAAPPSATVDIPMAYQLLFVRDGFGHRWARWATFRATCTRYSSIASLVKAWRRLRRIPAAPATIPLDRHNTVPVLPQAGRVTVLIPTLRRYPYLRVLLEQLRGQTAAPIEILVVDQTPVDERNLKLKDEFSDLPLRWFFLDEAGQCSSRNFGLNQAQGEYILFLDDDDEIEPDLVARHLANHARFRTNVSNGVAIETGSGELPADFRFVRVSNVFPTNNTLIRKNVLHKSGLFDLAYDHGQRADHDLGFRLYLGGELMVLDPGASVLHHHAPMGGLREHRARVDTYAASRSQLFKQVLPSVSDIYLAKRYFTLRQVREQLWIAVLGTFSVKGSVVKRLLKALIAVVLLPKTIHVIRQRVVSAERMLKEFPQIPLLEEGGS